MLKTVIATATVALCAAASATTVLDFEDYATQELTPASYVQGSKVDEDSMVTTQFSGINISNAALVASGLGHAASGKMSIAPVNSVGEIDYRVPVTFEFFSTPVTSQFARSATLPQAATVNYFAYSADQWGYSGNTVTLRAYGLDDKQMGEISYVERTTFKDPLVLSGIGDFHKVTVGQSLYFNNIGGIALDEVTYGTMATVSEPNSGMLLLLGCLALFAVTNVKIAVKESAKNLDQMMFI
jgi:hypothetical protein